MSITDTPRPRSKRLTPDNTWDSTSLILPALVTDVLRAAYPEITDIHPHSAHGAIRWPEGSPSARVRPRNTAWSANDRLIGTLIVVTFDWHADPIVIDPLSLVDRDGGYVRDQYMTNLHGVSLRLRSIQPVKTVIRTGTGKPSYAVHAWSASARLGGAA
ncbi:hypothetical protein AB0K04_21695 [Micromonospora coxensis]|uniref:hypothetical protein n=1 Tax=Micromonospora coxensis TaxID=356852 RepID=UPI0034191EDF